MQIMLLWTSFLIINSVGLGGLESASHALHELQIPPNSVGLREACNCDVLWQLINVN